MDSNSNAAALFCRFHVGNLFRRKPMNIVRQLALFLTLVGALNAAALSAESFRCDPDELTQLLQCAADAMDACYEALPDCAEDDVAKASTADVISSQVYEQCCYKPTKGAKTFCLKAASNVLKLAKPLLPAGVRNDVSAKIRSMLELVKSRGECDEDDSIDDPEGE